MQSCRHLGISELYSVKRTFQNRNYYGSRDVLFSVLEVSKGQSNDTEIIKTDINYIYLIKEKGKYKKKQVEINADTEQPYKIIGE